MREIDVALCLVVLVEWRNGSYMCRMGVVMAEIVELKCLRW